MRSRPMPVSTDGFGRGLSVPARVAIELHEDEIPDFDVASAIAGKFAVGMAFDRRLLGPCRRKFRCRAAGAGVAHGPEIIFQAGDGDDAVLGRADIEPEVSGFIVRLEHVAWRRLPRRRTR